MSTHQNPESPLQPAFVWDILKELGAYERHFNVVQAQYRALASGWLLAALGGMGFVMKEHANMPIPPELAVFGIAVAASGGIWLIWLLDLLVYHRLLYACFTEAKALEEQCASISIPQIRQKMRASQPRGTVIGRVAWFYIVLITGLPAITTLPLVIRCTQFGGAVAIAVAVAVALSVFLIG
jgi:hypothetical protein